MKPFTLACILWIMCSIALSSTTATKPASIPGLTRLSVELPGPVRRDSWLPLKLTFYSDDEAPRRVRNVDFLYEVLDENGRQVVDPRGSSIFIRDALIKDVDLSDRKVVYNPKLVISKYVNVLKTGRKYQLIVVLPKMGLAGAVWFTDD